MRKLVIGLAMASTAMATPALARDDAWYVELDGGAMIVEDLDLELEGTDTVDQTLDLEYGYDFGGIIGLWLPAAECEGNCGSVVRVGGSLCFHLEPVGVCGRERAGCR